MRRNPLRIPPSGSLSGPLFAATLAMTLALGSPAAAASRNVELSAAPPVATTAIGASNATTSPAVIGADNATPGPAVIASHPLWTWGDDGFLPFPNDQYSVADPSTPTGRRLAIPESMWSKDLLARVPLDAGVVLERMRHMDGFSPDAPLMISIPADVDPAGLPSLADSTKADSPVILLDLETHQRLAFRYILIPRKEGKKRSSLLALSTHDRLENGRHYAVVIRRGLKDRQGQPVTPPEGFSEALAAYAPRTDPHLAHLAALGSSLRGEGLDLAQVALAFDFTTESRQSFTRELDSMVARIHENGAQTPYHVKDLRIHRVWLKNKHKAAIRVKGSFDVLNFIDARGVKLRSPVHETLKFRMEMPAECPEGGCPVAIFGHGLSATKETMFQVSDRFAEQGIATIGVAAPYHTNFISPLKVILGSKHNLDMLHGVMLEHILRNIQLVQLISQDLATPSRNFQAGSKASETPLRLRGDRLMYIGQSLGGICGVTTTALSPEIKASIFDVAGGSGVDMIFESWVGKIMRLPLLRFAGLTASESDLTVPLAVYLFDDIDSLGFAPYVSRDPLPGAHPRLAAQQAGLGDGLVPNWTSEKLSRALGIPLVRSQDVASTLTSDAPGPGLRYFRNTGNWFMNHLELMKPQSSTAAADFFAWSLKQMGSTATAVRSDAEHPTSPR